MCRRPAAMEELVENQALSIDFVCPHPFGSPMVDGAHLDEIFELPKSYARSHLSPGRHRVPPERGGLQSKSGGDTPAGRLFVRSSRRLSLPDFSGSMDFSAESKVYLTLSRPSRLPQKQQAAGIFRLYRPLIENRTLDDPSRYRSRLPQRHG
jgi:hypothetical protein